METFMRFHIHFGQSLIRAIYVNVYHFTTKNKFLGSFALLANCLSIVVFDCRVYRITTRIWLFFLLKYDNGWPFYTLNRTWYCVDVYLVVVNLSFRSELFFFVISNCVTLSVHLLFNKFSNWKTETKNINFDAFSTCETVRINRQWYSIQSR